MLRLAIVFVVMTVVVNVVDEHTNRVAWTLAWYGFPLVLLGWFLRPVRRLPVLPRPFISPESVERDGSQDA